MAQEERARSCDAHELNVVIEEQNRGHDEQFRLAFQKAFNSEVGEHYMIWKYWENPWKTNLNYVALLEGRVIGALGCLKKKLQVGGRLVTAAQEMDMFVVKEYRQLGVYFNLFRHRAANAGQHDIAFSFGVTSAFLRELTLRLFQFSDICEIPHLCKVITTHKIIRNRIGNGTLRKSLASAGDTMLRMHERIASIIRMPTRDVEIVRTHTFGKEYDEFWGEVSRGLNTAVIRDSSYMNWRYFENPDTHFTSLVARRGKRIEAVLVFTEIERDSKEALLMEFLLRPGEEAAGLVLLHEAIRMWREDGVEIAWCWMLRTAPGHSILRRLGFFPRRRELYLQVRSVDGSIPLPLLADHTKWYLTLGDTDFFYGRQI